MSEAQITKFSQFSFYVTAQIDRINSLLQHQQHLSATIDQLHTHIKRHQNRIQEVDNKVKLIEVYQSENFKNNERLFNSQLTFDALDNKISVLQKMQAEIMTHSQQKQWQDKEQTLQRMHLMEQRMKMMQNEIRGRNATLSKFRRDVSPTIVNCDSTKDISMDGNSNFNTNQLKRMEVKMHQYINQRLKIVEKKFYSALNADRQKLFDFDLPDLEDESFIKNRLTSQRSKQKSPYKVYQINGNKRQNGNQQNFRNAIDSYYNQTTQKEDRLKMNRQGSTRQKNQGKSHKPCSKSKSKKKIKENSSKKSISLRSVTEYLKIAEKTK